MNLMPLATLLEDAGLGTKGSTLFVDMLPMEAARAILLRNPLTGTPIDYYLPDYFKGAFQLIVRVPAGSYDAGEELINQVMEALTMNDQKVEDLHFNYCRPRHLSVVFPLSEGNLLEFSTMFDCCFVRGK